MASACAFPCLPVSSSLLLQSKQQARLQQRPVVLSDPGSAACWWSGSKTNTLLRTQERSSGIACHALKMSEAHKDLLENFSPGETIPTSGIEVKALNLPSFVQMEVFRNIIGSQEFSMNIGPIWIFGEIETSNPTMNLVLATVSPDGASVSHQKITGTEGTLAVSLPETQLTVNLVMTRGGLKGKISGFNYHYEGFLAKWPEVLEHRPKKADSVKLLSFPGPYSSSFQGFLDATLRDPITLQPSDLKISYTILGPGEEEGTHSHGGDYVHFIMKGSLRLTFEDGSTLEAKAGDVVQVPGTTKYSAVNTGTEDVVIGGACFIYVHLG